MEEFLVEVRKLAYGEVKRTGMPVIQHVDLAKDVGVRIAKELGADVDIVEAGTLLMDCALGQALKENRQKEHVQMSVDMADKLLANSSLAEDQKEKIRYSILEHHGVDKFHSLESEIVCNADCYKFASIKGFTFAVRYLRDMPFEDLIKLLKFKVDEKWNAISLDFVKKELESEYKSILGILNNL